MLKQWLKDVKSCQDAVVWVGDKTLREAYRDCPRPAWMVYGLIKLGVLTTENYPEFRHRLWEAGLIIRPDAITAWDHHYVAGVELSACALIRDLYPYEEEWEKRIEEFENWRWGNGEYPSWAPEHI